MFFSYSIYALEVYTLSNYDCMGFLQVRRKVNMNLDEILEVLTHYPLPNSGWIYDKLLYKNATEEMRKILNWVINGKH